MPKMIDADKLLEHMDKVGTETRSRLRQLIESGTFDLTPPVQPDTPNPGDKVRHIIYGTGVVDNLAIRRYLTVQFPGMYTGCWAEELEVITDEQR